ncbi:hypothetical protein LXL04_010381 [Taraxacum kok-saghyz]
MGRTEVRGASGRGRGSGDSGRGRGSGDTGRGKGSRDSGRGKGSSKGKGTQSHLVTSGNVNNTQSNPTSGGSNLQPSGDSRLHLSPSASVIGVPRWSNRSCGTSHPHVVEHLETIPDHQGYDSYGEDEEDSVDGGNGDDAADDDIVGRGSNVTITPPTHPSQRMFIERAGRGFTKPVVTHQITLILRKFYTRAWVSWGGVDKASRQRMYDRFKWLDSEANIYNSFLYILKNNFRELLRTARRKAAAAAKAAGHVFLEKLHMSMRDYPPGWIRQEIWHELCDVWNGADWRRKSENASINRSSMVDGRGERETTPMGYSLYVYTPHGKFIEEESSGSEPSEHLDFITTRAGNELYRKAMIEKYGDDLTQHPVGDDELWKQCAGGSTKGRVFGVGNSDPYFMVSRTPNCGSSSMDYARSQHEMKDLQARLDESEARHQEELAKIRKEHEESEARQ